MSLRGIVGGDLKGWQDVYGTWDPVGIFLLSCFYPPPKRPRLVGAIKFFSSISSVCLLLLLFDYDFWAEFSWLRSPFWFSDLLLFLLVRILSTHSVFLSIHHQDSSWQRLASTTSSLTPPSRCLFLVPNHPCFIPYAHSRIFRCEFSPFLFL